MYLIDTGTLTLYKFLISIFRYSNLNRIPVRLNFNPVSLLGVGRIRGGLGVEHDEILATCRLRPDQVHPDAQMGKSPYYMT